MVRPPSTHPWPTEPQKVGQEPKRDSKAVLDANWLQFATGQVTCFIASPALGAVLNEIGGAGGAGVPLQTVLVKWLPGSS